MRYDLAPLLHLCAEPGDFIYQPPSPSGLPPRLLTADGLPYTSTLPLPSALEVVLWGWEPHILQELHRSPLLQQTHLHLPTITPAYYEASHRQRSTDLLSYLIERLHYPSELLPIWIEDQQDEALNTRSIRAAIDELAVRNYGSTTELMLKRPYSSSGRGVLPLPYPLQPQHLRALLGNLRQVGSFSLEPLLDVRDNWAIEYQRTKSGRVHFVALSHFDTGESLRGYAGNELASPEKLWQELASHCGEESLRALIAAHIDWLEATLAPSGYIGYIGIDLFLYHEQGKLALHPCVEINLRTTMGVLAHLVYERYLAPQAEGRFLLTKSPLPPAPQLQSLLPGSSTEGRLFSAYLWRSTPEP